MIKTKEYKQKDANSILILFAFFVTVIFQITVYKHIWGIELISRWINTVSILLFSGYSINSFIKYRFNKDVYKYYIFPGILVYTGFFINITLSSIININIINQYGLLICWAIYLAIPGLVNLGKLDISSLWRYFNYFMLVTVSLSIVEYYAMFDGVITPRPIMTSGGPFLAGYFSILYEVGIGELHYRFYSSFLEPGTLAMFLLPAMAYAFLHHKYVSLIVYSIGMYLSDSLGGFIGVVMLVPLLLYTKFNKRFFLPIIISLLSIFSIVTFFGSDLTEQHRNKEYSSSSREQNFTDTVKNLPQLFVEAPLGLPLTESTERAQKNKNYYGSNFTPGYAFFLGGIISFIGYIVILFVSIWYAIASFFRKDLSLDEQAAVVSIFSLIPFIFQRSVVWDTSIFALLFAPFVIKFLEEVRRVGQSKIS